MPWTSAWPVLFDDGEELRKPIAELIATGLWSGRWPVAPATAGSAAALMLYWALPFRGTGDSLFFFAMIAAVFIAGTWAADRLSVPGDEDPGRVVIDEWVGVWVTVVFLPAQWHWLLAGFFLFRVLDILKPLGIRKLEKAHGGVGIMLDDLAAGAMGAVILNAFRLLVS
jgi:phosphatidylglycerophosphatase A